MGGKNAKQHKKTGCGYGYLPLWTFINQCGKVCTYLPFSYFNFNSNLPLCTYKLAPCVDLTNVIAPVKPFNYELKTTCGHCKGKIKIKDGIVKSKCKCNPGCC